MTDLQRLLAEQFPELPLLTAFTPGPAATSNQWLLDVPAPQLKAVAGWLTGEVGASLVQMVGVDERPIDGHFKVYTAFHLPARRGETGALLVVRIATDDEFPSLTLEIPAAHWYEREIHDLLGLTPVGHPDLRPLVLHAGWPRHLHPLRKDFDVAEWPERTENEPPFSFQGVSGAGIAEVPVGPIHAGIIEPGHFRFSALGENVIRLEAQLFYTHRGVEKRAEGMSLEHGLVLAERVCAACSLSHATAYAQAAETLLGVATPPRAAYLRTIALEMERLYNHVGDVGNLCAGGAFAFGNTQGMRLKEQLMQLNEAIWGHRWLRGVVALGGVRRDLTGGALRYLLDTLAQVEADWQEVVAIIQGHSIFQDRITGTGKLPHDVAQPLGVVGVAARASGINADLRRDLPYAAYASCRDLKFKVPVMTSGDVAARMQVRIEEASESLAIIRQLIDSLPGGPIKVKGLPPVPAYGRATGYVESPRGADLHFLMTGEKGEIYRYMVRSASYPNWAAVPYAVPGNLVADFPLINKSFELCYSCLDR